MKSKVILITVVVLTIAASIFLMVWQRQQKEEEAALPEVTATQAPTETLEQTFAPEETPGTEGTPAPPTENPAGKPNPTGSAFAVYINGKTISIACGVDEKTLDKGPGWQESSALPGQDGMCVIYGHRNRTHLRILETVEAGDSITATLPDGSKHTYIVTQVHAFENSADLKIPTVDGKSIALITCWPFRYSGSATGKYLVVGQLNIEAVN